MSSRKHVYIDFYCAVKSQWAQVCSDYTPSHPPEIRHPDDHLDDHPELGEHLDLGQGLPHLGFISSNIQYAY